MIENEREREREKFSFGEIIPVFMVLEHICENDCREKNHFVSALKLDS